MVCFSLGAAIPLVAAAFITDAKLRMLSVILASTVGLALFGAIGTNFPLSFVTVAMHRPPLLPGDSGV